MGYTTISTGAGFLPSTAAYCFSQISKSHRDISEPAFLQEVM